MTQLLLVEDQVAYRDVLALTLERDHGLSVVLRAANLAEAREAIARPERLVDVALVGQRLPDGDGAELRVQLQAFHPACHLIVLGIGACQRDRARAIAAGAAGVFPRSASIETIVEGITRLTNGNALIPHAERVVLMHDATELLSRDQAIRTALGRLTPREWEILQSLARGMSDKETGAQLGVSTKTVSAHMASLLHKLGVDSRLKAVLVALRFRVVALDGDAPGATTESVLAAVLNLPTVSPAVSSELSGADAPPNSTGDALAPSIPSLEYAPAPEPDCRPVRVRRQSRSAGRSHTSSR